MCTQALSRAKDVLNPTGFWEKVTHETTPRMTAVPRTRLMSHPFEVSREIGFLETLPLMTPLDNNSYGLSSFVKVISEEDTVPVEDEGVRRI